MKRPVCPAVQLLVCAAVVLRRTAPLVLQRGKGRAGSAPTKGVEEPRFASSSALSFPGTSTCPGTHRRTTEFPRSRRPSMARLLPSTVLELIALASRDMMADLESQWMMTSALEMFRTQRSTASLRTASSSA